MLPQAAPVQPDPVRVHVTAVFDAPATGAAKDWVPTVETDAAVGLMLSDTVAAAIIATLAEADLEGSAMLVARTLTVKDEATLLGGV
jgi:hypothetical protein